MKAPPPSVIEADRMARAKIEGENFLEAALMRIPKKAPPPPAPAGLGRFVQGPAAGIQGVEQGTQQHTPLLPAPKRPPPKLPKEAKERAEKREAAEVDWTEAPENTQEAITAQEGLENLTNDENQVKQCNESLKH